MRQRRVGWLGTVLCLLSLARFVLANGAEAQAPEYRLLHKFTLGGEGGWDYFDVDPDTNRVFIPRDTHILVVDAEAKPVADIPNVRGAHAIAFAPGLKNLPRDLKKRS